MNLYGLTKIKFVTHKIIIQLQIRQEITFFSELEHSQYIDIIKNLDMICSFAELQQHIHTHTHIHTQNISKNIQIMLVI